LINFRIEFEYVGKNLRMDHDQLKIIDCIYAIPSPSHKMTTNGCFYFPYTVTFRKVSLSLSLSLSLSFSQQC
jgi:hypothetical protein